MRRTVHPAHRLRCRERFAAAIDRPEEEVDLARAALWLAAEEYPDLDPDEYVRRIDSLGERVRRAHEDGEIDGMQAAVAALRRVLVDEEGFRGDAEDYYDPRNSFLNEVLDRRVGLPITLSVLWMEVGARAGLALEGVGLPAHFVVRLSHPDRPVLIDPFGGGAVLTHEACARRVGEILGREIDLQPYHFAAVGRRQILLRMLNNLRHVYIQDEEVGRALATIERIALIAGETRELRRERGALLAQAQLYGSAWADLSASVDSADLDELDGEPDFAGSAGELSRQLERVRWLAAAPN